MTTRNQIAEQRAKRLPRDERSLYETFCRMGMDPAAALTATKGRGTLSSEDPAEQLVETFEPFFSRSGRSPEQTRRMAESAVQGRERDSLREISESLRNAGAQEFPVSPSDGHPPLTREEEKVRDSLTPSERRTLSEAADRLVDEHRLGRTYGSDARQIAERVLLRAALRRMEDQG